MKAVTVLISGGFGGAYERLLPEFERTSLIKVTTRSGYSRCLLTLDISTSYCRVSHFFLSC